MPLIDRNDANALIPVDVTNQIFQELPASSICLSKFRTVRMSHKQQRVPVLSTLPTAAFRNGDHGRGPTTKMSWTDKFLNAEELVAYVPIPKTVLDDADFPIWDECRPRVVEAMAEAIDLAILFGSGKPASWDAAIVPAAVDAGNVFVRGSIAGQLLNNDIGAVVAFVEDDGFAIDGYAARMSIKAGLRGLVDENKQPIFQPSLQAGTPNLLYAEPIQYARHQGWVNTEADLIAGAWRHGIIGLREDVEFEVAREGVLQDAGGAIEYNLLQMGMRCLVVTMRLAYTCANPVTRLNDNGETRFPFAVLKPTP
jgi:HK97 family phage major capsid protein